MNKTVILEGAAALTALEAIAEARSKYPVLNWATDEEVLSILVNASLTGKGAAV